MLGISKIFFTFFLTKLRRYDFNRPCQWKCSPHPFRIRKNSLYVRLVLITDKLLTLPYTGWFFLALYSKNTLENVVGGQKCLRKPPLNFWRHNFIIIVRWPGLLPRKSPSHSQLAQSFLCFPNVIRVDFYKKLAVSRNTKTSALQYNIVIEK